MSNLLKSLILSATVLLTACGGGSSDVIATDTGAPVAVCFRDADDGCDALSNGQYQHAWAVMPIGAVVASDSGNLPYVSRTAAMHGGAVWIQVR